MISLAAASAADLRAAQDRLHALYRQCFTAPPWNETDEQIAAWPQRLARQTGMPGASGFLARDRDEITGAVYGWPAPQHLPDDTDFDRAVRDATTPEQAALLVAPALVVAELMVTPESRRRGVTRALLHRFLAGHPRAWLATRPDAPAAQLYETSGWQHGAAFTVAGTAYVIYTREAPTARHTATGGGPFSGAPAHRRPRGRWSDPRSV